MTISKKQLQANRKNAPKGGVKTPEGKAIVKYNALRHRLLAREAVVTVGEGAENPDEFSGLLATSRRSSGQRALWRKCSWRRWQQPTGDLDGLTPTKSA
jgi:hypothetical protein